jgi:hypothetical protein
MPAKIPVAAFIIVSLLFGSRASAQDQFGPVTALPIASADDVAVGDVNGDGLPDLITMSSSRLFLS